jgi:hypothetical protein
MVDLIIVSTIPRPRGDGIRIGEWSEDKDGTLSRTSFLPPGMSIEEAERIAAGQRGNDHLVASPEGLRRGPTLDL